MKKTNVLNDLNKAGVYVFYILPDGGVDFFIPFYYICSTDLKCGILIDFTEPHL